MKSFVSGNLIGLPPFGTCRRKESRPPCLPAAAVACSKNLRLDRSFRLTRESDFLLQAAAFGTWNPLPRGNDSLRISFCPPSVERESVVATILPFFFSSPGSPLLRPGIEVFSLHRWQARPHATFCRIYSAGTPLGRCRYPGEERHTLPAPMACLSCRRAGGGPGQPSPNDDSFSPADSRMKDGDFCMGRHIAQGFQKRFSVLERHQHPPDCKEHGRFSFLPLCLEGATSRNIFFHLAFRAFLFFFSAAAGNN